LAIEEVATGRLIGNASLSSIDRINRSARISLTIGESAGISAGVEVYGLLIEHAFCRLNLNRVADGTHENLRTFVRMLSVLGFEEEGVAKEAFLRDGKFSDIIYFRVLASTFFELRSRRDGSILFEDIGDLLAGIVSAVRAALKTR
jgi:RimJ/RimL family protein N-acetyltransferase